MPKENEMTHVVAKAFKTLNMVFAVGAEVSPEDIHPENAVSFEDYKARGFIKEEGASAPAPSYEPAKKSWASAVDAE
jgi:hypothetical protein